MPGLAEFVPGQPDMRYMWHEASPYFDTPVALYSYDYTNRDYTDRRFGMEFASRFRADGGVAERR